MPSAKQARAAAKRQHRKWHPESNMDGARRRVLQVVAHECGQSLVTVPVKHSKFMPESETETKWLDTFSYWVDPSQAPTEHRTPVDRLAYAEAQDPRMALIFGI